MSIGVKELQRFEKFASVRVWNKACDLFESKEQAFKEFTLAMDALSSAGRYFSETWPKDEDAQSPEGYQELFEKCVKWEYKEYQRAIEVWRVARRKFERYINKNLKLWYG